MKENPSIAIVGATGVVGSEMVSILEESALSCASVKLLASESSAGEIYGFRGEELVVETLQERSFEGVDVALFALSSNLAEKFVPVAVDSGALVIDNSSHFRMKGNVPLAIPEVNGASVTDKDRIISNPNCSTIQLVPVLAVIHDLAGLKRVVVSTYQAVSGAGKGAMDELWEQTRSVYAQKEIELEAFQHQIAFNCIPQIDVLLENGYTREEFKIINETRKILDAPGLPITATAVRVPVFNGHAESVNIETEQDLSVEALIAALDSTEGIVVYPSIEEYPMQLQMTSQDEIHVGRIRRDESVASGFDLWVVADNIRKGAALNAVQILQHIMKTV